MSLIAACEPAFWSEVARIGQPALLLGALLSPTYFAVPNRYRVKVLTLVSMLFVLPGLLGLVLLLLSGGSACTNLVPICRTNASSCLNSLVALVAIGLPLSIVTLAAFLVRAMRKSHYVAPSNS